jgi:hypothetical protein
LAVSISVYTITGSILSHLTSPDDPSRDLDPVSSEISDLCEIPVIVPCFAHQYSLRLGLGVRVTFKVRVCLYIYGGIQLNFAVHYIIHYITFTILVRETWNDITEIPDQT